VKKEYKMKTDQLMTISLMSGEIHIYHNSAMGDLSELFKLGNTQRMIEGKKMINQSQFLKQERTLEFIDVICKERGLTKDEVVKRKGRGKNSRFYAQLHLLIFCAEALSPIFHYKVIELFISEKILTIRDVGGDDFKDLNALIDKKIPDRVDKNNMGLYIYTAKVLKSKIFPNLNLALYTGKNNIWNSQHASSKELKKRDDYEKKMMTLLEMNVIESWEHFKSFLDLLE
jgi:hypothetical protein